MEKVRVFLTDWQVLFRAGVHLILAAEKSYEIIGEAATNEGALDFIENNRPGVAILNADRGVPTGIEIARRIKQNLPSVAIILMMDNHNDEERLFAALKSGANACLSKDVNPAELLDAIKKAVQGEYPITQKILEPAIAARIINEFEILSQSSEEADNPPARLLSLEAQILKNIAGGTRLEEIARNMSITEDTIRQRLYTILGKLVANEHHYRLNDSAPAK